VGRDGRLELGFERRGDRTVLTERRYTLPLQVLEVMALEEAGAALMLLNPTGGVLGGDHLDTRVRLGAGSQVCLTTPSATRVYRSLGAPARQHVSATLDRGARLEYIPDHLIPSPGARLEQRTVITLAAGAAALVWDAWAVGRPARDEAWAFTDLDVGLEIGDERGPVLRERARLAGHSFWGGLGGAEGMMYAGSFVAVVAGAGDWAGLTRALGACTSGSDGARVGVTPLARGGVLARVLAPSAPLLTRTAETLWSECRRLLFALPPLGLRKL
jgi:urease accessory protein